MTKLAPFIACLLLGLSLSACTKEARERFARDICDNAPNCDAYGPDGNPVSKRDYCVGNEMCGPHP